MANRLVIGVLVNVGLEKRRWKSVCPAKELVDTLDGVVQSVTGSFGDDLNPITSGNNQTFSNKLTVHERSESAGARFFGERQTLAHLDRRGFMIDSY